MPFNLVVLALGIVIVALSIWQGNRSDSEVQKRFEQERGKQIMYNGRPSYEPIFAQHLALRKYEEKNKHGEQP